MTSLVKQVCAALASAAPPAEMGYVDYQKHIAERLYLERNAPTWLEALCQRVEELEAKLNCIQSLVDEQAQDEGLWAVPALGTQRIAEAYLQQELRKLHAVVEAALGDGGREK